MRSFHLLPALILGSAVCYASTVSISQPSASTSTSPVSVHATVTGSSSVLQLYVDGKKVTDAHATTLSTSVALPVGTHRIAVQSVDSNHAITKTVKYVTVEAAQATGGTSLSNLQEASEWSTCGACGNTGGGGTVAKYTMSRGITSPAINNSSTSAQFWIGGSAAYTNAYWYLKSTAPKTAVKKLLYDFYLYVPAKYERTPQAIEFECQQTINGYTYNYAWQANYKGHIWRTFDYVNKKWTPTAVPFPGFTGGTWHHIIAEYHAEGTHSVHDALTVDGVRYTVGVAHPAKASNQTWGSFTNAFQLDLDGSATDYSVYVDKMKVTYW